MNEVAKGYGSISPSTHSDNARPQASVVETGSIRAVLTRPVLIAIQNYGWLSLLEISYWAILTVFLPIPVSAGGLNLPPPTVGIIFGILGLVDGLIQLLIFPPTFKRFGPKKIMTGAMMNFWMIFACFPWMHEIAKAYPTEPGTLDSRVWAVMGLLIVLAGVINMGNSMFSLRILTLDFLHFLTDYMPHFMVTGVNFMFIGASAPDPTLLGTTNGLAQMVISFTRALGPFGATALFSTSMVHPEFLGLKGYGVFMLLGILTGVAVYCTLLLPGDVNMKKKDEE